MITSANPQTAAQTAESHQDLKTSQISAYESLGVSRQSAIALASSNWKLHIAPDPIGEKSVHLSDLALPGLPTITNESLLIAGRDFLVVRQLKDKSFTVFKRDNELRKEALPELSEALLKYAFGGDLPLMLDSEAATLALAKFVTAAPVSDQKRSLFIFTTTNDDGKLHLDLADPEDCRHSNIANLALIHGVTTLFGGKLSAEQLDFIEATKTPEKALALIKSLARWETVETPEGKQLLAGEPGSNDHSLSYWGKPPGTTENNRFPSNRIKEFSAVWALFNKFDGLKQQLISEISSKFISVAHYRHPEVNSEGELRQFSNGASALHPKQTVHASDAILFDLYSMSGEPNAVALRKSLRCLEGGGEIMPSSTHPSGLLFLEPSKEGVCCGRGYVTRTNQEIYFAVPKGQSGNFLIYFGSDNEKFKNQVYGVNVSRDESGEWKFANYNPGVIIPLKPHQQDDAGPAFVMLKPV